MGLWPRRTTGKWDYERVGLLPHGTMTFDFCNFTIATWDHCLTELLTVVICRILTFDLDVHSRKNQLGAHSQTRIQCLRMIPNEGENSGRSGRSESCVKQSAVGVRSTLTRRLTAALEEGKVTLKLGN